MMAERENMPPLMPYAASGGIEDVVRKSRQRTVRKSERLEQIELVESKRCCG